MTAPADIQHNHSAIVTKNIGIQRYNQGQDTQEVYIRNIRNNANNKKQHWHRPKDPVKSRNRQQFQDVPKHRPQ